MNRLHRLALGLYRRYQDRQEAGEGASIDQQRRAKAKRWRPGPLRGTLIEPLESAEVTAEWVVAPTASTRVTVLWFHGGSFLFGSPSERRGPMSRLSRSSGARVLASGYRLAPEHPFPAALEDAVAAYRWLLGAGIDPERLVIGGDSAGGGLALSALVSLRDSGSSLPAGAVLFSPWTDLSLSGDSITALADVDDLLDASSLRSAAEMYLGGENPRNPLASPLFADLAALPPMFVQPGGAELLLDDSAGLVDRIREAGGEAILDVWADMPHVFQNLAPIIPEAGQALHQAGRFVRRVTRT